MECNKRKEGNILDFCHLPLKNGHHVEVNSEHQSDGRETWLNFGLANEYSGVDLQGDH
jgi:hypothetical protein